MKDKFHIYTILLLLSSFLCFGQLLSAQTLLSPQEAAEKMLQQNYDIRLAKNDVRIADNNTSKELNGYLPTINASGGPSANLGSSTQKFGSGQENKVNNALSWSANASVNANYTLYNKSRDLTVEQLKEVLNLTNLQLRQTVEFNLLQVLTAYYNLAQLTERLDLQQQTITLSQRRKQRAQYRFDYGQGSRLDVLNAQVDIQRDTVNLLNLEQQLANSKRNLNMLIGQDVQTDYRVDTTVQYLEKSAFQNLLQSALTNNVQLLLVGKNMDIQEYNLQITDASRRPVINSTASYALSYQDNAPGAFITNSSSSGLGVGVNVAWNLYDGGLRKAQQQNIRINIENQLVQREQIKQQIETDLTNFWQSYQNALFILEVEQENSNTAQLNFERTEEQFNFGQISSVEFRQAQLNLLTAATSLNQAKYDAKVIELQLLQLSGDLLDRI